MDNEFKDSGWNADHEKILVEWGDKAMCYRWLHSKAFSLYYSSNAWFTIPVIIISTLTGTANFAQQRVPEEYQNYFSMVVGGFNILAGIISTIQQFLKITQLTESHRVSSIAWDKFYRNIKIELAKHPSERTEFNQLIKTSKEEFDRLTETSPNIPEKIILQFKDKFKKSPEFNKIVKPEICDTLIPTDDYKNGWSSDINQYKILTNNLKNRLINDDNLKKIEEENMKVVNDFTILFKNLHHRDPLENEIVDNLKDKIDIYTIKHILKKKARLSVTETNYENLEFGINEV
jgi:hypothetical protein